MPKNLAESLGEALTTGALFFVVGMAIGFARLASGPERVGWRLATARAFTTGGVSMSAGALLLLWPDAPLLALLGASAALASMGTSALENVFFKLLERKK